MDDNIFSLNVGIQLGIEIQKLSEQDFFNDLSKFIMSNDERGKRFFYKLKPLYDTFGYHMVNGAIYKFWSDKEDATRPKYDNVTEIKATGWRSRIKRTSTKKTYKKTKSKED